jgi:16S rRNA (cytosine1402-N4)-methyltransferase
MEADALLINDKNSSPEIEHKPVLLSEAIRLLNCRPGGVYVDATVGLGGHAERVLEIIAPEGKLIGVDRDKESLALARERLDKYGAAVELYNDNFKNLPLILHHLGHEHVDGILMDLGVSSYQLLSPERGFSFQFEAPLDMRMDRSQRLTAAVLVNRSSEEELADIIFKYGEEPRARRIARAIVHAREAGPITKTTQLSRLILKALGPTSKTRIHPATKTFQALRIAVNDELTGLEDFILNSVKFLKSGGRLVVIAFHSLEDRIVKVAFKRLSGKCICSQPVQLCRCEKEVVVNVLTRKPVAPSPQEIRDNPRARSASLRAYEKI